MCIEVFETMTTDSKIVTTPIESKVVEVVFEKTFCWIDIDRETTWQSFFDTIHKFVFAKSQETLRSLHHNHAMIYVTFTNNNGHFAFAKCPSVGKPFDVINADRLMRVHFSFDRSQCCPCADNIFMQKT